MIHAARLLRRPVAIGIAASLVLALTAAAGAQSTTPRPETPGVWSPLRPVSHTVQSAPRGYTPSHLRATSPVAGTTIIRRQGQPEMLPPPREMMREEIVYDTDRSIQFDLAPEPDCCGPSGGPCSDDGCGTCCIQIPCFRLPQLPFDNFTLFAGVQGFTGPVNLGQDGSFGLHEGANWGLPIMYCDSPFGFQIGARATQSNFHGANFTNDDRTQVFFTTGFFRRVDYGLQFGGVYDYLSDDWYVSGDLSQFRGEISWVFGCQHELGFLAAGGGKNNTSNGRIVNDAGQPILLSQTRQATDYYAFFYRRQLDCGGEARVLGGFTSNSGGLLGADTQVPLFDHWSLGASFTYLIPQEQPNISANRDEAWNVSISLIWHPWGCSRTQGNYYRPLFNVADNGSFMTYVE